MTSFIKECYDVFIRFSDEKYVLIEYFHLLIREKFVDDCQYHYTFFFFENLIKTYSFLFLFHLVTHYI